MRYCFGEKIRTVRERRSLTLREVADRAGVSESLVSQIERNRVSPAIDTLLALTDALDLDLEYLFADYRRDRPVRVTRSHERNSFTKPGVLYERLAQVETQGRDGIEAYTITIEAGAKTGSREYGHPGWELGIVEKGQADLTVGNEEYTLNPGDSVSFKADAPHMLVNSGDTSLRVFWIITPPKGEIGKGA
ncbi:MAG: XRE family transcriptional regulator [Spirochaetaceae bacterium]|jgi:transcriptional regulator with XRE-family HTH domain|nr:XRE family transcriptional regulator [Spirochaetaceae bacterium]